jgi:hypothetical protein
MRIPSGHYAAVTSTLALVVALGGTSYAATQIGTNQIAANAVTSPKIKNDSIQGKDVKESTLGRVPSASEALTAAKADLATKAEDADTVNGVTPSKIFLYTSTSVADQVLFSGQGLTITASCDASNFNLDLVAATSKENSYFSIVGVADSNPTSTIESDSENSSFSTATPIDLLLGDDGDVLQSQFTYSNADGSVVTGTLSTDVGNPTCSVRGTVFASS